MNSFAMYRLPLSDEYTEVIQTDGEPEELLSCAELSGCSGYVFAPFAPSAHQPILLIHPNEQHTAKVNTLPLGNENDTVKQVEIYQNRESYTVDFANFHAQLENGFFRKIVLARQSVVEVSHEIASKILFARACKLYPRMFIALVYTPQSGFWLTATPEILVEGNNKQWHTMALAGTMKLSNSQLTFDNPPSHTPIISEHNICWSDKNLREQRYVATYITECLEHFTSTFQEEGPYTTRAGELVHLRSDFTFTLSDDSHLGDLLEMLHPTPAVCGLPKDKTCRFILENEANPRRYYSGFIGPLNIVGDTHLFVTLRCMQIDSCRFTLYAGGGLLAESEESKEWEETEAKMETMKETIFYKETV